MKLWLILALFFVVGCQIKTPRYWDQVPKAEQEKIVANCKKAYADLAIQLNARPDVMTTAALEYYEYYIPAPPVIKMWSDNAFVILNPDASLRAYSVFSTEKDVIKSENKNIDNSQILKNIKFDDPASTDSWVLTSTCPEEFLFTVNHNSVFLPMIRNTYNRLRNGLICRDHIVSISRLKKNGVVTQIDVECEKIGKIRTPLISQEDAIAAAFKYAKLVQKTRYTDPDFAAVEIQSVTKEYAYKIVDGNSLKLDMSDTIIIYKITLIGIKEPPGRKREEIVLEINSLDGSLENYH